MQQICRCENRSSFVSGSMYQLLFTFARPYRTQRPLGRYIYNTDANPVIVCHVAENDFKGYFVLHCTVKHARLYFMTN